MAKSIPYFRPEMLENGTLWGGTYLYGLYIGVPPPPPRAFSPRATQDSYIKWKQNFYPSVPALPVYCARHWNGIARVNIGVVCIWVARELIALSFQKHSVFGERLALTSARHFSLSVDVSKDAYQSGAEFSKTTVHFFFTTSGVQHILLARI